MEQNPVGKRTLLSQLIEALQRGLTSERTVEQAIPKKYKAGNVALYSLHISNIQARIHPDYENDTAPDVLSNICNSCACPLYA